MSYQIIDQLCNGEEVTVIGTEGDWYKVVIPEKTGYVHSDYLELIGEADENSEIDSAMLMLMVLPMEEKRELAKKPSVLQKLNDLKDKDAPAGIKKPHSKEER